MVNVQNPQRMILDQGMESPTFVLWSDSAKHKVEQKENLYKE